MATVTLDERYRYGSDTENESARVGARAIVGARTVILANAEIGDDVVVGANAVVVRDVDVADVDVGLRARSTKVAAGTTGTVPSDPRPPR